MNENTTTGIISNTTGSLFIRFELNNSLGLNSGPIQTFTVHWTAWRPDSGPSELMLSVLGLTKAPEDQ